MPRVCSACTHDRRREIDTELLAGTPLREIAGRFSLSIQALDRHRNGGHIAAAVERSQKAKQDAQAIDLIAESGKIYRMNLRLHIRPTVRSGLILAYVWAGLWLAAGFLLFVGHATAQRISFSLQSHGETCDQIGNACKRLSLWTATVTNDKADTLMIAKPALLRELVKIGVAARDDQSAARVVLHREKRGGWRIVGRAVQELLYGCSTATLPENPYIASGCGLTALFGPRTVERAAGLEPQVSKALTEILGTQFLELAPNATGMLVLFSTRYSGEATYEVALNTHQPRAVGPGPGLGSGLLLSSRDGREVSVMPDTIYPMTSTPTPAKAWEIPAGTWLPVGHYWGPCAEWRGHVERF